MIRRTVLWRWADGVRDDQKLQAKEGMAYCRFASPVEALDFGEDLGLARGSTYDLLLVRDHTDQASWDAYDVDLHHHRVGANIDAITQMQLTARTDVLFEGPASVRGRIRDTTMYVWRPDVDKGTKDDVRAALTGLPRASPTLVAIDIGDDIGLRPDHHDWIVETHFDDLDGLLAFLDHPQQKEVQALVGSATDGARTARVQSRMLSG